MCARWIVRGDRNDVRLGMIGSGAVSEATPGAPEHPRRRPNLPWSRSSTAQMGPARAARGARRQRQMRPALPTRAPALGWVDAAASSLRTLPLFLWVGTPLDGSKEPSNRCEGTMPLRPTPQPTPQAVRGPFLPCPARGRLTHRKPAAGTWKSRPAPPGTPSCRRTWAAAQWGRRAMRKATSPTSSSWGQRRRAPARPRGAARGGGARCQRGLT
eukprot:343940-Chlamydomonas_euryale.AAC.10